MKDVVILVPVYNPDKNLMTNFLTELKDYFKNIVLVNDGCDQSFNEYINSFKLPIVVHNINLGKGRAIKDGINYILKNFDCKTITVADCDGQHSVEDIIACSKASLKNPDYLVLGIRNFKENHVPFKSRFGNIITRNILYHYTGVKLSDTQTGLRSMSISVAKDILDVEGDRFEYETNVLLKKNLKFMEVPIETIYINDNITSHFNPLKDSLRVYKSFAPYILVSIVAYIIENIIFYNTFNLYIIPISLLISKVISSIIIYIFNKHINILYTIFDLILITIILLIVPSNYILIKILLEIIIFASYIL